MRGFFVTGTDTGVGKTVLAAALIAVLRATGLTVAAYKPVVTGMDEALRTGWPRDHELLAAAAGSTPAEVTPRTYGPPVSPHLAAALVGERLELETMMTEARTLAARADVLVVEGVGGLLVPFSADASVLDLATALGLDLLVAARPGLGTINHTLLTVQAARVADLRVRAVVLTPWPAEPSTMEHSNRKTIEDLGHVAVVTLPRAANADPHELRRIGSQLPLTQWLSRSALEP